MEENIVIAQTASLHEPNNVYRVYQYAKSFFVTCNEKTRPKKGVIVATYRGGQSVAPNAA